MRGFSIRPDPKSTVRPHRCSRAGIHATVNQMNAYSAIDATADPAVADPPFDATAGIAAAAGVDCTADAIACLRRSGVPVTQQRIDIARVLFEAPVHLCAEQVWDRVRAGAPETSRATVYNTLRLFSELKLIRELCVDPQRMFYDSTTAPHFHMYNVDTGELRDLAEDELTVLGRPQLPEGVELQEIDVVVRVRSRPAAQPGCA